MTPLSREPNDQGGTVAPDQCTVRLGRRGIVPPELHGDLDVRIASASVFMASFLRTGLMMRKERDEPWRDWREDPVIRLANEHVAAAVDDLEAAKRSAAARLAGSAAA